LSDKLHQFVAGAPVELGFYGGESNEIEIDWFEQTVYIKKTIHFEMLIYYYYYYF